ncbi:hypothetical protein [Nocardioides sp.]|uniref:hypothetical protein n=1 Tax=Nocardioides sp. TaxID=35761 RepID=UPI001A29AAE9|nr:hypothetical protein [Nocardioides sp.]MBJ7356760.1 hypothetical protein [Nocardioides sp.]
MRISWKDLVATLLLAAIAVPYIGYLVRDEMPFIEDPRGMAATGLLLGIAAFLVMRQGDAIDRIGKLELAAAGVSLALGVTALVVAETAAAEAMLAVFMGSLLIVWMLELTDHVGVLHHAQTG